MTSMKTRILTAVIAIPLILIVIFLISQTFWVATVILSLATALMTMEYLTASNLAKNPLITLPALLFSFTAPLFAHTKYLLIPLFAYIVLVFFIMIIKTEDVTYKEYAFAFSGTFLITFGMSCFSYLCTFFNHYSAFFFVLVLATPWMADAGAYFAGTFLGKHKLCPKISPKKTVEGFLGGVVFCILTAIVVGLIFQNLIYKNTEINYMALVAVGVLDSVISVIGDLSFSLIKRYYNIKDYGSIFPGHGGMLDRCDSVIFTAPLILCINQIIPIILVRIV